MGKKLLIDLMKLREYENVPAEGILKKKDYEKSFRSIRELATFHFTCRKCEKTPCVTACPVEALKKDGNGVINRAIYKCIRCKSCIVICPFGTLVDDLFAVKGPGRSFIHLNKESAMEEFASYFPDDVVSWVDAKENKEQNIYALNDDVLIIEKPWK